MPRWTASRVSSQRRMPPPTATPTLRADRVVLGLRFEDDQEGEVARLVADYIFSHMGNGRRLDGRAPIVP